MGIYNKNIRNNNGISYSKEVDGPSDWIDIESETYFKDLSDSLIYYKNSNDIVISIFEEAGITSADNGLNISTSDDIELGGTLNKDTDINGNNKTLNLGTLTDALNGININSITSTRTHTFPGFDSITSEYTPGNLTINSVSLSGDQTHQNTTTPFQYRREISDTSTNVTSYINLEDQLTFSSENTSTSQVSNLLFSTNQTSLSHSSGSGTSNVFTQADSETSLYYSGNTQNGITITGDTINLYGPETNIDLNISGSIFTDNRVSGSTKGLEYGDDYHLGFTDRTLVDKAYVDDSIVNNITSSAGSGLTFNTTTNKIDLGGTLTEHTYIKGLKAVHLGFSSGLSTTGFPDALSMLSVTAFAGTVTLIPNIGNGYFQRKDGSIKHEFYADTSTVDMGFNPESNLTNIKHYINEQPGSYTRNIYITNDLDPLNKLNHDFSVANGWIETSIYKDFGSFVISNKISNNYSGVAINGQGITSAWNLQLGGAYGDTHILTNPTSILSLGLNEHSFTDLSSSLNGVKLLGFGEDDNDDTTNIADYSTLVNTSLVPKKYVDDTIVNNITASAGAGLTFNTTTNKIDLGGVLEFNDPGNPSNNMYFTPSTSGSIVRWGADSLGNLPTNSSGAAHYISRFDYVAKLGEHKIFGSSGDSGVNIGVYESQSDNLYIKQYKDVSQITIQSLPGINSSMTFLESDSPNIWTKTIWESHDSNTKSYTKQTFDTFEWSVHNNTGNVDANGNVLATGKTFIHVESERILMGAAKSDGTKFGIFQFASTGFTLVDGDFKGVGTFPTAVYLGNLGGSNLIIEDSNDSTFTDGTTNKRGIKYIGFGETDTETGVDADYTTLVGTSLVPKKYVDDSIVNNITGSVGAGLTFNTTTNKIDLGGVLDFNDPSNPSNNMYFTPTIGSSMVRWGVDSSGATPNVSGNPAYITRFDYAASSGEHKLFGLSGHPGVNLGVYNSQTSIAYIKQYKDVSQMTLQSTPGVTSDMTFQESDNPFGKNRTIWQSHNSNTKSVSDVSYSKHAFEVYNTNGHKSEVSLTDTWFQSIIRNTDNSKIGQLMVGFYGIALLDGDSVGVQSFPNSVIIGKSSTAEGLTIGVGPTDSKYAEGSDNKKGIRYTGFGETPVDEDTGVGADYSTLVNTSLVPKKYVDDAILDVHTIYNADDSLTDDRIVYLDNNKLTFNADTSTETSPINFEFGGSWEGYTRWGKSGSVTISVNDDEDPLTILNKVNSTNFIAKYSGGGYLGLEAGSGNVWRFSDGDTTANGIEIGRNIFTCFFGGGIMHKLAQGGGSNAGAHFYQSGISGTLGYFIVGGNSRIGTEKISLQDDTLISGKLDLSTTTDGFLMPRLTTAQMDAILSPDTDLLIFNTDLDCVMRYDGIDWTTFDSPNYIVRSEGVNTPYSDFKKAVDDAPEGAVIDVYTSEVIDVGMPSTYWDWTKDLTIQTNGHNVTLTNLSRIQIGGNLNTLNIIGGGTFSSSHDQVFIIYRSLTINSDGATNIISTNADGILFQPILNTAGTTLTINNLKSKGTYFGFSRNNNTLHATILNRCDIDLTNSTNGSSLFNNLRITANNCVFKQTGGQITYPQNTSFAAVTEDAFIFNNCTLIGNFGRCMLRLNNCSVITNSTSHGVYELTLEANNTTFKHITTTTSPLNSFAIKANNELVILKNCTIDSDLGGVYLATKSSVIDNCVIKSGNSWGVFRYNTVALSAAFLTIKNSSIESGEYTTVGSNSQNLGKQFDISNTTIITSGASSHCLGINTGTHARFDNLKLKNISTPTNIYNRAGILSENPQIETTDSFGNIILK